YFAGDKNFYAQATAFGNTGPAEMEAWLITPVINTDNTSDLSLKTSFQSWVHDGLSIWVTTNYTGDPSTTIWQEVKGLRIATKGDVNQEWVPSGTVSLKSYGKNLRIGFKHVGSQAANTTSYRIDDILVK
ncbi:MAG TPA: choice-of-anchor J domain-containing protein, partial [Saprospiraceae bacterium]|nr:choice-of-anchor J domain-containing protein [Saprospiraceae bacterium]